MLFRHASGFESEPLQSGSSDVPSLTQGAATTFKLDSLPIRNGRKAYYLVGIFLTIMGTFTQAGGAGSRVAADNFIKALVASLELRNCWHGTPIKSDWALGEYLGIMEYVGSGFSRAMPVPLDYPAANGAYNIRRTFFIPLCQGANENAVMTAQLALFYKKAQLVINTAAASVITGLSAGSSISSLTCRASACLYPAPKLWLGPGNEWVFYESTAAATPAQQIPLNSFGNVGGLTGVEPNAGQAFLMAMAGVTGGSAANNYGGSFSPNLVTSLNFPWRGQNPTNHMDSIIAMANMSSNRGRSKGEGTSAANTNYDFEDYPYILFQGSLASATEGLMGLVGVPLVHPTPDLKTTKVQIAYGDQYYNMGLTGGNFGGSHRTLSNHLKSWTEEKRIDAARQIVASGLARDVLGTDNIDGYYDPANGNAPATGAERFLPICFEPKRAA